MDSNDLSTAIRRFALKDCFTFDRYIADEFLEFIPKITNKRTNCGYNKEIPGCDFGWTGKEYRISSLEELRQFSPSRIVNDIRGEIYSHMLTFIPDDQIIKTSWKEFRNTNHYRKEVDSLFQNKFGHLLVNSCEPNSPLEIEQGKLLRVVYAGYPEMLGMFLSRASTYNSDKEEETFFQLKSGGKNDSYDSEKNPAFNLEFRVDRFNIWTNHPQVIFIVEEKQK